MVQRKKGRPAPRRRKKNTGSGVLLVLLALLLVGILAVAGILLVKLFNGSTQPEPTMAPTPSPTPVITPSPTPEPTVDITMGGIYTTGEVVTVDTEELRSYKSYNVSVEIAREAFEGAQIWVADVWLRDPLQLKNCFAQDVLSGGVVEKTESMAQRSNALFAVNADYAAYRSTGLILRDGVLYRDNPAQEVLAYYPNGEMKTFLRGEYTSQSLQDALHVWSFGPALLINEAPRTEFDAYTDIADIITSNNPRTGVGMFEAGHYLFAVVDAPQRASGMTLEAFSRFFAQKGCTVAYNMDGGSSSVMIYKGEVLNSTHGEVGMTEPRPVSEIIYIPMQSEYVS